MPIRQPLLHDLVCCVQAPTVALCGPDGQVRASGAQGVLHGDFRVLAQAVLLVDGAEPEPIGGGADRGAVARFTYLVRSQGDPGADPTVRVNRVRTVGAGEVEERVEVVSTAHIPVRVDVRVTLAAERTPIDHIKDDRERTMVPVSADGVTLRWGEEPAAELVAPGAAVRADGGAASLEWSVDLPQAGSRTLTWRIRLTDREPVVRWVAGPPAWSVPRVEADDRRLPALLDRALDDLAGLRLVARDGDDVFIGGGVPWFLTLFGRDSIWAARMALPLGTELAGSTLRVLAARQGVRHDRETGEAPGKIPHELRRAGIGSFPPLYYGTVDATPLWICLLHDAWRWGLPEPEVAALLPHAEAALNWMADGGDADGDGLLEYVDTSGYGLANQGWKDSGDAIRFADGRLADGPVALCEVQGYAHEAALHGADLLDAFARPGAQRWRRWAAELADRFRERFWVTDAGGPFPALALDGAKRPVDSLTSNAGHLLGTGLLDAAETALVAGRMVGPDMASGFGLRTMSARAGGYSPLSYHCGSVWPHDTAIVLHGLARTGHGALAGPLVAGLLRSGTAFGGRLPELFAGDGTAHTPWPVPYPAACRPQAWSAAAAVTVLQAVLGLSADVPGGRITLRPMDPPPVGALSVAGLRAGGTPVHVSVDREGRVTDARAGSLAVDLPSKDRASGHEDGRRAAVGRGGAGQRGDV